MTSTFFDFPLKDKSSILITSNVCVAKESNEKSEDKGKRKRQNKCQSIPGHYAPALTHRITVHEENSMRFAIFFHARVEWMMSI